MNGMAAKTGLAALSKPERKIASSYAGKRARSVAEKYATRQMLDAGVGGLATVGAAVIDHKFREGADSEARFGKRDAKLRPPVNGVIGLAGIGVGLWAAANRKRWAGTALAIGAGAGSPALYNFTRDQLDKA